jgi:hypothetical protein
MYKEIEVGASKTGEVRFTSEAVKEELAVP